MIQVVRLARVPPRRVIDLLVGPIHAVEESVECANSGANEAAQFIDHFGGGHEHSSR